MHQDDNLDIVGSTVAARSVLNRRDEQQDAVLLAGTVAALADGMGGHPGGAKAATVALTVLDRHISGPCSAEQLADGIEAANRAVSALSSGEWRNPGTTIVAVATDGEQVHGAWCGDSRAYRVDADGTVTALTNDHALRYDGLFACLGDHGPSIPLRIDTFDVAVGVGAKVLLTSDGTHGPLNSDDGDEPAIADLLGRYGVGGLVVTAAEDGRDNATAVLVDIDDWVAAAR